MKDTRRAKEQFVSPYEDPLTALMDMFNIETTNIQTYNALEQEAIANLYTATTTYAKDADPPRAKRMVDIIEHLERLLVEIEQNLSYEEIYTTWFYIVTKLRLIHTPYSRYIANIAPPDELFKWDDKLFANDSIAVQSRSYYRSIAYKRSGLSFSRFIRAYRRVNALVNWLPSKMSIAILTDITGYDDNLVSNLVESGVLNRDDDDEQLVSISAKSLSDLFVSVL